MNLGNHLFEAFPKSRHAWKPLDRGIPIESLGNWIGRESPLGKFPLDGGEAGLLVVLGA